MLTIENIGKALFVLLLGAFAGLFGGLVWLAVAGIALIVKGVL